MMTVCSILTLIFHSVSVSVMKACKIDEKVIQKLPAAMRLIIHTVDPHNSLLTVCEHQYSFKVSTHWGTCFTLGNMDRKAVAAKCAYLSTD